MKIILQSMRGYRRDSILAPLLKMLEALLDLFVPFIMKDLINVGIAQGDRHYVLTHAALLVGIGVFSLLISITAQYFAARAAVGAGTVMRRNLFAHISRLGAGEVDRYGNGHLITRMTSDINQTQNGINLFLRLFLRSPFIVFGSAVCAFRINFRAALVFAAAIPLLAAVIFGIMKLTKPMYGQVQNSLDRITGIVHENLTGVRVVRVFGRSDDEVRAFAAEDDRLVTLQKKVGRISALMNPLILVIVNLAVAAILSTGAVQVNAGTLAMGDVIALVNYMTQILVELVKLANLMIQISRSLACAERIEEVMNIKPAMEFGKVSLWEASRGLADGENEAVPAVEFENVCLRYGDSSGESLTGISFRAMPGETIGIIGGTGSGKSSLVSLIPRFYDATGGCVRLYGRDVREYSRVSLRSAVGVVSQKARLFSGTIRSNLQFGDDEADDAAMWRALEAAQAAEFVKEREGQLDAAVEQGGRNFSGGQKQRLTIARALVGDPEILILDDSASALDYATDAALRKAVREMSGSRTIFIVSQRTNSVMGADRIIVLDDGEAVGIGTHAELMEKCEVYRAIYESQYGSAEEA